jgi:hypothetical protein
MTETGKWAWTGTGKCIGTATQTETFIYLGFKMRYTDFQPISKNMNTEYLFSMNT